MIFRFLPTFANKTGWMYKDRLVRYHSSGCIQSLRFKIWQKESMLPFSAMRLASWLTRSGLWVCFPTQRLRDKSAFCNPVRPECDSRCSFKSYPCYQIIVYHFRKQVPCWAVWNTAQTHYAVISSPPSLLSTQSEVQHPLTICIAMKPPLKCSYRSSEDQSGASSHPSPTLFFFSFLFPLFHAVIQCKCKSCCLNILRVISNNSMAVVAWC